MGMYHIQLKYGTREAENRGDRQGVFDCNLGIIFHISPTKLMLWALIRIASLRGDSKEYPQHMLKLSFTYHQIAMSLVLICFSAEQEKKNRR